eukprot:30738-Pelagomonas_calceolata.AAC.4
MSQPDKVAVIRRTLNAKKEHVWAHAQMAPPGIFQTYRLNQPGTFFGSSECERLNQCTEVLFMSPAAQDSLVPFTVGAIELGFDFGQCFKFKERSTGGLFASCLLCGKYAVSRAGFSVLQAMPSPLFQNLPSGQNVDIN